MPKILVTGAFGQIGSELIPALQAKHGANNVVAFDMAVKPNSFDVATEQGSIVDLGKLKEIIVKHNIDTVYHLVSILSAKGERDPNLTWQVNMDGLRNILNLAVEYKLKVFWPSSIAAFGPTTPRDLTPQHTVLEPTTIYGITKMVGEALCHYYYLKFGVDVRSMRFPGLISWKTEPGGGTTDYAVAMFYEAVKGSDYTCFVHKDTILPMMYMDDAIRAMIMLMDAPVEKIAIRTSYNLTAISFSAEELAIEINKHLPLAVKYEPDFRQRIADSWPQSIDDSAARADWGWHHEFDLQKMATVMIEKLKEKL
ncbi:MAG: NAD-dependent epimerase/dehydratase family protein [Candidatus Magasanikbacteria bacterium]|nr:NAD-dependent epimerase/dehydratase family protein [Candidatus Magasanikbacteria bacterium]